VCALEVLQGHAPLVFLYCKDEHQDGYIYDLKFCVLGFVGFGFMLKIKQDQIRSLQTNKRMA